MPERTVPGQRAELLNRGAAPEECPRGPGGDAAFPDNQATGIDRAGKARVRIDGYRRRFVVARGRLRVVAALPRGRRWFAGPVGLSDEAMTVTVDLGNRLPAP